MIKRSLITLSLVVLVATQGLGQFQLGCPSGDDGFAGAPCCTAVQPNIPNFPSVTSTGKAACLLHCGVEAQYPLQVVLGAPNFAVCDIALINASITPAGPGAPGWSGVLLAKYSRTFNLVDATGLNKQVWRFIVNGDLQWDPTTGGPPCPVPACVTSANPTAHWWGSIDYECENLIVTPGTAPVPVWKIRMDLNHAPGCVQHSPFTTTPLSGPAAHDDRSYHMVAPANFVFAPVAEPVGPTYAEAVRSSGIDPALGAYVCYGEAPLDPMSPGFNTVFSDCLCAPSPIAGGIWKHQNLSGFEMCAGAVNPYNNLSLPGTPFPTGFVTLTLGFWTGGQFPGGQNLCVHVGVMNYQSMCPNNFPVHIVTGVSTSGVPGTVFQPNPVGPNFYGTFTDLANHKGFLPNAAGQYPPIFGSLAWSDTVWNLNLL